MYKHASASLQRRHKVHEVDYRASAYVHTESDYLPSPSNLTLEECQAERARLLTEKAGAENDMTAAKNTGNRRQIAALGHRLQAYSNRLGLLNRRIREINIERGGDSYRKAVREIVPPEMLERIHQREREIREGVD